MEFYNTVWVSSKVSAFQKTPNTCIDTDKERFKVEVLLMQVLDFFEHWRNVSCTWFPISPWKNVCSRHHDVGNITIPCS